MDVIKMATTMNELKQWFESGVQRGATHMIVVCDTWDYEDYPVYVMPGQNVKHVEAEKSGSMNRIMEVYSMSMDMDMQLKQVRSFNY